MEKVAEAKFLANVDRSGGIDACHPWMGGKGEKGYGHTKLDGGRTRSTHRIALALGRPIAPGKHVLHNCPGGDNPSCCNPKHLREGTNRENVTDRVAKGRNGCATGDQNGSRLYPERRPRGERCASAVLTEALVRELREEHEVRGVRINTIARRRGLGGRTVRLAILRETWKHVV